MQSSFDSNHGSPVSHSSSQRRPSRFKLGHRARLPPILALTFLPWAHSPTPSRTIPSLPIPRIESHVESHLPHLLQRPSSCKFDLVAVEAPETYSIPVEDERESERISGSILPRRDRQWFHVEMTTLRVGDRSTVGRCEDGCSGGRENERRCRKG